MNALINLHIPEMMINYENCNIMVPSITKTILYF